MEAVPLSGYREHIRKRYRLPRGDFCFFVLFGTGAGTRARRGSRGVSRGKASPFRSRVEGLPPAMTPRCGGLRPASAVRNRPSGGEEPVERGKSERHANNGRRHTDSGAERRLKARWKKISLVWNSFDAKASMRGRLMVAYQRDVRWTHATRGVF
ncbi:hypothetical protein GCM10009551_022570 [Nocardiopsis tropica]